VSEPFTFTLELSDEQLDALADRVAERLRAAEPEPAGGLVDAATVAAELGVSRDTIYANAAQLGGVQIGDGPRPRWRFDLKRARSAWRRSADPERMTPRRRRSANGRADLLPVHGADDDDGHRPRIEQL